MTAANPSISVRAMAPTDIDLVFDFIQGLAEYEQLAHEVVATPELLRTHLLGPNAAAEVVIGEIDGEPTGFALFFTTFSTFLGRPGIHLEDLFVLPDQRSRGLGTALLAHLAELTLTRGYGRLEWNVLDWNEPALRFYRRLGAVGMEDWTTYRLTAEPLAQLAKQAAP